MTEELPKLIERYNAADTKGKRTAAKSAFTRWLKKQVAEIGILALRQELKAVELPKELKERLVPGSLYQKGDRVFGWYSSDEQVQAEHLPLIRYRDNQWKASWKVSFFGFQDRHLWEERGFGLAEALPLVEGYRPGRYVQIDHCKTLFFLDLGYAVPCALPWTRDEACLTVTRSIISAGWWQAWKWWEGCQWWYLEKRPELFADLDWWGNYSFEEQTRHEPQNNPYAAVLGGSNKEYWESVKWKLG